MKNVMRWMSAGTVVFCLALVSGCMSTSSYHTARPIEEGTTEMGMALEMGGAIGEDADSGVLITHPRVVARRGLTENADLGFSGGNYSTGVDFNYMLVDAEPMTLSLNPSLTMTWEAYIGDRDGDDSSLILMPLLGLLVDIAPDERFTFTGGIKPGIYYQSTRTGQFSETDTSWLFAFSVGARIDLEAFFIFPEFNFIKVQDEDDLFWTFGVAFGF